MNWHKLFWNLITLFSLLIGIIAASLNVEVRTMVVAFSMAIFAAQVVNTIELKELIENRVAAWNVNGDGK